MSWQGKCGRIKTTCWGENYWKWGDQKRVRRLTISKNCVVCVIVLSAKISWFSGFSSRPQSNFLELQKILKHSVVILRLYKRCYFHIIAETDTLLPKSPHLPKVDRILKLLSNTRKYFNQLLLTTCSGHSKEIHSTDKRRKSM